MKTLLKQLVVGGTVIMTLAAGESLASAKEKGVPGTWTLSAEGGPPSPEAARMASAARRNSLQPGRFNQTARSWAISRARHQEN